MSKDSSNKQLFSVYTVEGIQHKNKAKINYIDNIELGIGEKLYDTEVDRYEIDQYVIGRMYACNLLHTYLTSTKKLPMLYSVIWWIDKMQQAPLYSITVYFNIESDIKSREDLLTKTISGRFSIEVNINGKSKEIDQCIEKFPGTEEIKNIVKRFTQKKAMKEFHDGLIEDQKKLIADKYGKEFENYVELPKATISFKNNKL